MTSGPAIMPNRRAARYSGGLRRRRATAFSAPVKLRWTNLVAWTALLACPIAAAPWLAGLHWTCDNAACFAVQAMAVLILAAIALATARRFALAGVAAAFAIVAAAAVVPDWVRSSTTAVAAEPRQPPLRVMAMNLLRINRDGQREALARIREFAPDVLLCSELTPRWHRLLAPQLTELPHRICRPHAGYFGIGLFSRHPLREGEPRPLAFDWAPAIRAVIAAPAGDVGFLGVHTPRPGNAPRCIERDRALASIADALQGFPQRRIVAGDFNATPWNHAFAAMRTANQLSGGTTSAWRPTWPSSWPMPLRIPIDHILLGGSLTLLDAGVGATFGSDHLPLTAIIAIAD